MLSNFIHVYFRDNYVELVSNNQLPPVMRINTVSAVLIYAYIFKIIHTITRRIIFMEQENLHFLYSWIVEMQGKI